ncbi:Glycosyltransferase, GT2 family [Jannaschia faecimaris]|uniref:Glycosyltransferase, GT2 family n=1 Tax=Jannaschia faecimaris TaxID=1244108 RepID=A0A1H3K5M1_9RHOB|nr:glycosyltransferase [Jannaschia faecimaris]SDY47502.1 Glycosyltransferase, GT2 family [Jannaschia faecimaris]
MLIHRLHRIFQVFAEASMAIDGRGARLHDAAGRQIGATTAVEVRSNRLIVRGTAPAGGIVLRLGAVAHPGTIDPATGAFRFDLPFETGAMEIVPEGHPAQPLSGFTSAQLARARWRLAGRFGLTLLTLLPQILRWKARGDMEARESVKETLKLVIRPTAGLIDKSVLTPPSTPPVPGRAMLLMPVHNAFDLVVEALDRVVRHSGTDWHLIVIEDASTDPRLRPWLCAWAAEQGARVTLLLQDINLGFIGAVNLGFEVARRNPDLPVVLINSDAMVPKDWLPRLLAPLADPSVASVTPMSNDAELLTVPVIVKPHSLAPGQGDALDAAARNLAAGTIHPDLPTGVGFCMALSPRFLREIPTFDTDFGRGYGEEVDWCRKALLCGGRHVCAQNLFVEHRGGASFGFATKQRLLEENGARIARRYPRFAGEVENFLRGDPLTTPRLALALSLAGLGGEVPVYLAHALGGGAEDWLRDRIKDRADRGRSSVVVRVGQRHRWRLEVHGPEGMTAGVCNDVSVVESLIQRLPNRRIIYSCGVSHPEAAELPEVLLRLADGGHPVEVLFHDFFAISPSYTLLDADSVFRGVPLGGVTDDPAHRHLAPDSTVTDLAEWQARWGRLVARAERVVTFSNDSGAHVLRAYPQARGRMVVAPHSPVGAVPVVTPPGGTDPVIGVLGNIGPHKGAAVLQRLSRDLARQGGGRLIVLGHLASDFSLAKPSQVHGTYRLEDLPGLVARYGIRGWFMPSVWPETFSFTTHEVLATGMPIAAFDLGAQGEAVRRAVAAGATGGVLPMTLAQGEGDLAVALRAMLRLA